MNSRLSRPNDAMLKIKLDRLPLHAGDSERFRSYSIQLPEEALSFSIISGDASKKDKCFRCTTSHIIYICAWVKFVAMVQKGERVRCMCAKLWQAGFEAVAFVNRLLDQIPASASSKCLQQYSTFRRWLREEADRVVKKKAKLVTYRSRSCVKLSRCNCLLCCKCLQNSMYCMQRYMKLKKHGSKVGGEEKQEEYLTSVPCTYNIKCVEQMLDIAIYNSSCFSYSPSFCVRLQSSFEF